MAPESGNNWCKRAERLSTGSGVIVALIAIGVLFGWAFHLEPLKRVSPGLVAMNPVTALSFALAAAALWLLQTRQSQRLNLLGRVLAAAVLLVGVQRLLAYVFDWQFRIDQLLFSMSVLEPDAGMPNQMAPNTALNFVLIGSALLLLDVQIPRVGWPGQYLSLAAAAFALLAISGYGFQSTSFYRIAAFIPMAFNSAVAFLVLSLGVMFARPDRGLMRAVTADYSGAASARRLLPAAVVVPLVLSWLRLKGEKAGYYDTAFGVALMGVITVLIFTALIWWNAVSMIRAEEQHEHFFNVSLDLLCIAGFDGYFKRLNPLWEKTLGFTTQELLARPYLELIHPDDRPATIAEAEKISRGAKVLSFENRYQRKDGTWCWLQWNAAPLHGLQLLYAAARDITGQKHAQQQIQRLNQDLQRRASELQQVNKELEAFSYSVSHDLRAPLRHIAGFVQLLQRQSGATLDSKAQRCVNMIAESAQEMGKLIDDLLSFARMGRVQMRAASIEMEPLVREVIGDLGPEYERRDVVWKIGPVPPADADRALLRQVWFNLLSNALKYTRTRSRAEIEIGCQPAPNREQIYFVRDNGVGFDMAYAEKLFGVFQRLHDAEDFEGTGIGLANVRRIITRHGGRTWAEGKADGGATFYFSLPAAQPTPVTISAELPKAA